jgi:hypothetical protein
VTYYWRIHRTREVTAYLVSLRDEGSDLRKSIAALSQGIPPDATETAPHVYIWFGAHHWIGCILEEEERAIYVYLVEKAEESSEGVE